MRSIHLPVFQLNRMPSARPMIEIRCQLGDGADRYEWQEESSEICWLTIEAGLGAQNQHLYELHGIAGASLSLESDPGPKRPSVITANGAAVGSVDLS